MKGRRDRRRSRDARQAPASKPAVVMASVMPADITVTTRGDVFASGVLTITGIGIVGFSVPLETLYVIAETILQIYRSEDPINSVIALKDDG